MPKRLVMVPGRMKPDGSKTWWDPKKRLEVLNSYIALGNLNLAAAACGVPIPTAKYWKATKWWKETEDEIRRGNKLQLSTKLSGIVIKATDQLVDRLEGGDYVLTKHGELIRKPVSAEHANKIIKQLTDTAMALEDRATTEKPSEANIDARLKQLREEILKFTKKREPVILEGEVTDGESQASTVTSQGEVGLPTSVNQASDSGRTGDVSTRPVPVEEYDDETQSVCIPVSGEDLHAEDQQEGCEGGGLEFDESEDGYTETETEDEGSAELTTII